MKIIQNPHIKFELDSIIIEWEHLVRHGNWAPAPNAHILLELHLILQSFTTRINFPINAIEILHVGRSSYSQRLENSSEPKGLSVKMREDMMLSEENLIALEILLISPPESFLNNYLHIAIRIGINESLLKEDAIEIYLNYKYYGEGKVENVEEFSSQRFADKQNLDIQLLEPQIEPLSLSKSRKGLPRLFISYSRSDNALVKEIVRRLVSQFCYDTWVDYRSIKAGQLWRSEISNGLKNCELVLFMASDNSFKSQACRWELAQALRTGKTVIPIRLTRNLTEADLGTLGIGHLQYLDISLTSVDDASFWGNLLSRLPPVLYHHYELGNSRSLYETYLLTFSEQSFQEVPLDTIAGGDSRLKARIAEGYCQQYINAYLSFKLFPQTGEIAAWWVKDSLEPDAIEASSQREFSDYLPNLKVHEHMLKPLHAYFAQELKEISADSDRVYYDMQLEAQMAVALQGRLFLIGEIGIGKTSFLRILASRLAGDRLETLNNFRDLRREYGSLEEFSYWGLPALTPLLIDFRELVENYFPDETDRVDADEFEAYVQAKLEARVKGYWPLLHEQLLAGDVLIMFDDLDKIPNFNQRISQISNFLDSVSKTYRKSRILISSRPVPDFAKLSSDAAFKDFGIARLMPFKDKQFEDLVSKLGEYWSGLLQINSSQQKYFIAQIFPKLQRDSIWFRPIFAALAITKWFSDEYHLHKHSETEFFIQIYDAILTLLFRWISNYNSPEKEAALLNLSNEKYRQIVTQFAFFTKQELASTKQDSFQHLQLIRAIENLTHAWANTYGRMLEQLEQQMNLILSKASKKGFDKYYQFRYQSLHDYFAAEFLANNAESHDEFIQNFVDDSDFWTDTANFLLDRLSHNDQEVLARKILRRLQDNNTWGLLKLLSRLVLHNGFRIPNNDLSIFQRFLEEIIESASLDIPDRIMVGDLLANIGDSRFGVMQSKSVEQILIPEIDWCFVDVNGFHESALQRMPYSYWISKYPITEYQFSLFCNAAYDVKDYWLAEIWEKRRPKEEVLLSSKSLMRNHPIVNVSWYEALAFCVWLSEVTKRNIQLPLEAEWERAACGTENWEYPTGRIYQIGSANFNEIAAGYFDTGQNNGRLVAVGLYPEGKSPFGVYDMLGNTWEWCLGMDFQDKSQPLRGGSWQSKVVESTKQNLAPKDSRRDSFGFRIVAKS